MKLTRRKIRIIIKEELARVSSLTRADFATREAGNRFRQWLNDNYKDDAAKLKVSPTGPHNNSYIQAAWVASPDDSELTFGKLYRQEIKKRIEDTGTSASKALPIPSDTEELGKYELGKYKASHKFLRKAYAKKDPSRFLANMWYMLHPAGSSQRLDAIKDPSQFIKGKIDLLFDGDYLHWRKSGATIVKWPAVAGATPWNEESFERYYTKNTDFSKMRAWGPPPSGKYAVKNLQTATGATSKKIRELESSLQHLQKFSYSDWALESYEEDEYDEENKRENENYSWHLNTIGRKLAWGNYRASFKALPGTNTYNRSGFYIHGGEVPGSHGCIDLLTHMDDFAKLFVLWQSQSGSTMILTVKYKPTLGDLVAKWVDIWDDGSKGTSKKRRRKGLSTSLEFLDDDTLSLTDKAKRLIPIIIEYGDDFEWEAAIQILKRSGLSLSNALGFQNAVVNYLQGKDLNDD